MIKSEELQDVMAKASLKNTSETIDRSVDGFETPDGLSVVAVFRTFSALGEAGLAVLAMGKAYWTFSHEGNYVLCVASEDADLVAEELRIVACLDEKSPRIERANYREFEVSYRSFVAYAVILITFFILQQIYALSAIGRVDSIRMVESGEWWRAVTALTLHGDVVHLVSNLVAGAGFAFFVARFFGAASAWCLILLSGLLGNALNAWVYYPVAHYSIGASTAVFGALGLLTGIGLRVALIEAKQTWSMPKWFIPVLGGLTLLGLTGVGDGLVDVAAHISGFLCGLALGFVCAWVQPIFHSVNRWKFWFGAVPLGVVTLAWVFRLTGSAA